MPPRVPRVIVPGRGFDGRFLHFRPLDARLPSRDRQGVRFEDSIQIAQSPCRSACRRPGKPFPAATPTRADQSPKPARPRISVPTRAEKLPTRSCSTCISARRTDRRCRRRASSLAKLLYETSSPSCLAMASWINAVSVWPVDGKTKSFCHAIPIQLVAFRMRRHPDLMHRRIGADDKLAGRLFELDGQRAAVEIHFELGFVGMPRPAGDTALRAIDRPGS